MTSALTIVLSIPAILMAVASVVVLRRLPLPPARLTDDGRALLGAIVARGEGRDSKNLSAADDFDMPMRAA